ncbi:MAG: hypothetical protein LM514_05415, partial [Streptococcus sp.]|nr:hypothetical protein [Streptococcus sp.]
LYSLSGRSLQVQKPFGVSLSNLVFLPMNALRPLSLPKRQGERMERKSCLLISSGEHFYEPSVHQRPVVAIWIMWNDASAI